MDPTNTKHKLKSNGKEKGECQGSSAPLELFSCLAEKEENKNMKG